eukprot:9490122-Pyramimonas_sp.AAC.2
MSRSKKQTATGKRKLQDDGFEALTSGIGKAKYLGDGRGGLDFSVVDAFHRLSSLALPPWPAPSQRRAVVSYPL